MAWMSDEEFIYRQDIKEKKAAGRGAFHKKGGSKSKKCNFPSDYMTRKEKQALNGEVFSYDPRKWYSWEEFKAMPMEYQIKYINSLLTRYNCSFAAIAKYVFQITDVGLRNHFTRNKQLQYINMPAKSLGKALHAGNEKLREDIEKALQSNQGEEIQNESVEEAPKELTLQEKIDRVAKLTLQEKIDQAAETVKLYESRGMEMTPELINQIYEEKTDMSFAMAMSYMHTGDPIGKVEKAEESEDGVKIFVNLTDEGLNVLSGDSEKPEKLEDCKDVESFSITMHELDQDVINYIRDLFGAKDILVKIEVHQIK